MRKKYLLLLVLLIFATIINSVCSKSRKEIISNKAIVEPINTSGVKLVVSTSNPRCRATQFGSLLSFILAIHWKIQYIQ